MANGEHKKGEKNGNRLKAEEWKKKKTGNEEYNLPVTTI